MASVASQLTEEVTALAQSDSLEDAREICTDGTYFPNNLRRYFKCTVSVDSLQVTSNAYLPTHTNQTVKTSSFHKQ